MCNVMLTSPPKTVYITAGRADLKLFHNFICGNPALLTHLKKGQHLQ